MPEQYWVIAAEVAWTDGEERVVVLRLSGAGETPQVMEGPAAAIWKAVAEGPITASEIADRVASAFDAEAADLGADVRRFLDELARQGLIASMATAEGAR